jgi:hypothetical protein
MSRGEKTLDMGRVKPIGFISVGPDTDGCADRRGYQ